MKRDYMEPQLTTRAYLQNVAIGTEEDDLAMTSLGDNDVEFEW